LAGRAAPALDAANAHLWIRPDAGLWLQSNQPLWRSPTHVEPKAGFDPEQPRDDRGRWTDADGSANQSSGIEIAGTLVRICVVSARSLNTDQFGNKSYSVTYDCASGHSFTQSGLGHDFAGIVIDPFQ